MAKSLEIRLYDPQRKPADWTDVIGPAQCAVLLKNRANSVPLSPTGKPFARREDATCLLFDRLDDAQQYCEAKVRELPHLACEILDAQGRAHPPLMVVFHPDFAGEDDSGARGSLRRKWIAVLLILAAPPLFWLDWRHQNTLILPTFLGFNCILLAMRFIYWHFGLRHRENERLKRLAAHRMLESRDA
jgi:hypothetical protein